MPDLSRRTEETYNVSSTSAMIQIASDDDLQSGFAFGRFG